MSTAVRVAAVLLTAAAWGCGGVPAGLPGTATCQVGRSERVVMCRDICATANGSRSESDREDLVRCARDECGTNCR